MDEYFNKFNWDGKKFHTLPLTEQEFQLISEMFYISPRDKYNSYSRSLGYIDDSYYTFTYLCILKKDAVIRVYCEIFKTKDEWFYVVLANSTYKCDQLGGLIECLNSLKNE